MQARAKLELREEATEKDAKDVVEIMKYRLLSISLRFISWNNYK